MHHSKLTELCHTSHTKYGWSNTLFILVGEISFGTFENNFHSLIRVISSDISSEG